MQDEQLIRAAADLVRHGEKALLAFLDRELGQRQNYPSDAAYIIAGYVRDGDLEHAKLALKQFRRARRTRGDNQYPDHGRW
jgi:hypothetical protein